MIAYHDSEWGVPTGDDQELFEKLSLESFQSGLSWQTILRKREHFRDAFRGFDFERVAAYSARDVERLLGNAGIIRHRGKIEATIQNARQACRIASECGSLAAFVWTFEPDESTRPARLDFATLNALTSSPESVAMSKSLKRLGWRFLGPTTAYAFMQAAGLVNDHMEGCRIRPLVAALRRRFEPPAAPARMP